MRKKGFTLIELLAVLIILGFLAMMVVPNIMDSINNSSEKALNISVNNLVTATNNYYSANILEVPTYGSSLVLKDVNILKEQNFIDAIPKDAEGVFFLVYTSEYTYKSVVILNHKGTYYSSIEKLDSNCSLYKDLCSTNYKEYYETKCTCN